MARIARKIIFDGSMCYHILVQGIAKNFVLDSDMLKGFYLKCLSEKITKYKINLLAFCVMGNHVHLLISGDEGSNISLAMKETNILYAKYYNRTCNRVGYVFRDRFKSEPILGEDYLINCIAYIHNNPVIAAMVQTAEEYPFSSAQNYLTRMGIVDFGALQELLGGVPILSNSEACFIDDEYEGKEDIDTVIKQVFEKYSITTESLNDDKLLGIVANEICSQVKVSGRTLATKLNINREKLRKSMSKLPSP